MSVPKNYNGPTYVSKDGNVFDNPFDANAANKKYEQQEKILKELKRQNDINEFGYSKPDESDELYAGLLLIILYPFIWLFKVLFGKKDKSKNSINSNTDSNEENINLELGSGIINTEILDENDKVDEKKEVLELDYSGIDDTKKEKEYCKPPIQLLSSNKQNDKVIKLREIIESTEYLNNKLNIPLGKDEQGKVYVEDIQNLLIIGREYAEIDEFFDTFIINMLYNNKPNEVNLFWINSRKTTLAIYENIPHLTIPIMNEYKKSIGLIAWMIQEMEYRYKECIEQKVRNIQSYNDIPNKNSFPLIVCIIQNFFDKITEETKENLEFEETIKAINRLSKEGQNVGIYLIISQTEDSQDIIQTELNNNAFSKIIFKNTKCEFLEEYNLNDIQKESDIIFLPKNSKLSIGIQKIKISDEEIKDVLDFTDGIKNNKMYR